MELNAKKVAEFIGGPKNEDWENGFLAGQRGDKCPDTAPKKYQDGYGRGYEAAEMLENNNTWFRKRGMMK